MQNKSFQHADSGLQFFYSQVMQFTIHVTQNLASILSQQ